LAARGYEVMSALDGELGLISAKTRKPELIILDLILPKKNGFEVLKELKADQGNGGDTGGGFNQSFGNGRYRQGFGIRRDDLFGEKRSKLKRYSRGSRKSYRVEALILKFVLV